MRIAFLIPSLGGGGAERLVLDLSAGLQRAGYENDIFILERSISFEVPDGIRVRALQQWTPDASSLLKGLSLLLLKKRLGQELVAGGYDLAVSHMERCNSLISGNPGGVAGVMTVHNYLAASLPQKKLLKRLFAKALYSKASRRGTPVVFVSETSRRNAVNLFRFKPENTFTIPNFINTESVIASATRPAPQKWDSMFKGPVVVAAGRLLWQKGHWHLIRSFTWVVKAVPDCKLVILGEGALRSRLQGLILSTGLEGRVFLPGFTPDLFPLMRQAHAFVLSSLYEGMPMILLEALACGCAIVSTDCPSGPREILAPDSRLENIAATVETHPSGLLVPPLSGRWMNASEPLEKTERILAEGIIRAVQDDVLNKAMRRKAQERVQDFSLERGVSQWAATLKTITERFSR